MNYTEFFEKLKPVWLTWEYFQKNSERFGPCYDIEDMLNEMIYGWSFVPEFEQIPKCDEDEDIIHPRFNSEEEEAFIKYFLENLKRWIDYLMSISKEFSEKMMASGICQHQL